MDSPKKMTDVLEDVEYKIDDDQLFFGKVMDTFQHRGYGPLLLTCALIIVLPSGGIPGVPTVLGVVIFFISIQLVLGRSSPWIPENFRKLHIKKSTFDKGADKIKPMTRKIDFLIKPRLEYMTSGLAARFIGVACMVIALFLPFTEVIPFSDIIPGCSIALLGLGLTSRDGLITVIGLVFAALGIVLINYWLFA